MSEQLTGFCPNCGNKLVYAKNDTTVTCYACDSVINAEEFSGKASSSVANEGLGAVAASMPLMMMGFDNPESGIVFIENFFDNYDWETYMEDTDLAIPEIAEVVKNNKMKNGACATSWYLDYKALAYPVRKKIEGLAMLQDKMAALYNPVDSTNALEVFDVFRRICSVLKDQEADIFKQLETAIKYAEKFSLDADLLAEMNNDFDSLKNLFENEVFIAKEINEVAGYLSAAKEASRKIADDLMYNKGINAESIYESALMKYNDGSPNKNAALSLFEQVRGYEDSVEYIKKINQYFNFNDEVYRAFGKHFIYKSEDYAPTLDIKQLKAKGCSMFQKKAAAPTEDAPQPVKALSLYEIVDGKPAKEATIKGIVKIITCYGSRLYYIKSNAGIHCFDIYSRTETCICKGEDADFIIDKCKIMSDGSSFYMVKLYKEEKAAALAKKGCSLLQGKGKNKKGATSDKSSLAENHVLNPYCVVVVDMKSNTCNMVIKEMAEFERNYGDKIFYYYSYKPEIVQSGCMSKFKKVEEPEAKKRLMVCDLTTKTSKEISEDCQLHTVSGDCILYSMWRPNRYNKDLHSYNLEMNVDTLIEKNIYNYFNVFEGKVYYTVGNDKYAPLVRNNLDGTERIEVMPNVQNIICERGGWLYVQKGSNSNSVLAKVSADGTKRVVICTQVSKFVRFEGNYLYYVDIYNNLRVVRIDGKGNRKLAENINKIFPCEDGLYYTRQEKVSAKDSALSLYFMDKDGRNIKKMVFDVDYVQNDQPTNTLYHSKTENVRFKVYAPKQEDKATYEFHKITKYSILDKATGESKLFLTLGWPSSETKAGCLKKKSVAMIYEEAPVRPTYEREDITDTTNPEDVALDAPAAMKLPGCIPEKSGCATLLKSAGGKTNLPNNGGKQSAKTKLFSMKSTKSAAKSTSSAKSKKAVKVEPKTLMLSLAVYVLLALGIMTLIKRTNYHYMGHGLVGMLWPVLIGLLCAAIALALLGILPLNLNKVKGGKVLAVFYIVTALLWIATGFVGMGFSSSSVSNDNHKGSIYTNQSNYVYVADGEEAHYSLYISESGEYLFKLSNCYDDVYIYTDANGSTYLDSSNNYQAVIDLYSGTNDITVKYVSSYTSGSFNLTVSKYEPFAENATKIVGTPSMGQDNTYSVSVSTSNVRWFELIAPQSGYYTFSLDSYDAYMVAYTNEDDTGNEHTSSFQVYLDEGDFYFIKIKGNTSYSTSVDFTVSGAGLTSDNAIEMSNNSSYDVYIAEGGYVWLKFYAYSGYTYSVSVGSNYTNTYIYNGSGYTENNYSGYTYSTSASSSYGEYFYVRINATTGGNVSVSLSRS
ncbi:MAG: DUF5050 domain-containing protein [Clostridia bacterium]|nr:DUF5050 domain-containing protein [Clostridia bacterium]